MGRKIGHARVKITRPVRTYLAPTTENSYKTYNNAVQNGYASSKKQHKQKRRSSLIGVFVEDGAGNETRTRDPDLGKVVLYQLSYSRKTGVP